MEVGETGTNDDPQNRCFGCSPHNPRGLRLVFTRTGEHTVEARYTVDPALCGVSGVVHGGIQATLLDETLGMTAHHASGEDGHFVTVDLDLRYRRPVPTEVELVVRGELVRVDGRDVHLRGEIATPNGEVLTTAASRWRRLRDPA